MNEACLVADGVIELPPSAPQIRVTAGSGSAGQKTWNLRRPVTLLGSKRPAHIVLHDRGVSPAHCVIINTGTDVLLFDLHTAGGTFRGKERAELVALEDGDIVTLGDSRVQVAIRQPEPVADQTGLGLEYKEPTLLVNPIMLSIIHTDTRWFIEKAVTLIGRNEQAAVRLDHHEVSSRHALLFRFGVEQAIYDLGSRNGVWVNGQRRELSHIAPGDRLTVGPFGLQLEVQNQTIALSASRSVLPVDSGVKKSVEQARTSAAANTSNNPADAAPPQAARDPVQARAASPVESYDPSGTNIAEAWERLNLWRAQLRNDTAALAERQASLSTREAEVNARDAAFREQFENNARLHDQFAAREKELAERAALVQQEQNVLNESQKDFLDKQIESQKKEEELHRREQAMAQRWSRMQSTVCPHCQKPVSLGAG